MGQFIMGAFMYEIEVGKQEKISKDIIVEAIGKEVEIECYDIFEDEERVLLRAKSSIFNKNTISNFIKEQYSFVSDNDKIVDEVCDKISNLETYEEIKEFADMKCVQYFQSMNGRYSFEYDVWRHSFSANVRNAVYFLEGKAYLECYYDLFKYMKSLIRKSSEYEIAGIVTIMLE